MAGSGSTGRNHANGGRRDFLQDAGCRPLQDQTVAAAAPGGMRRAVGVLHPRPGGHHPRPCPWRAMPRPTPSTRRPARKTACARCCRRASACCCSVTAISARVCCGPPPICSTPAMPARSWSMPTARPCRPRSCALPFDAAAGEDAVVLGPAIDGGYTLIGLSRPHARVFEDIPWSTPDVYRLTIERAAEIGVPVVNVPRWYDVDDRADPAPARSRAGRRAPAVRRGRTSEVRRRRPRGGSSSSACSLAAETSW